MASNEVKSNTTSEQVILKKVVASCLELDESERRISDRGDFHDVNCKVVTDDSSFIPIVEQFASRLCDVSLNPTSLLHLHLVGTHAVIRDDTRNRQSHLVSECNRRIRALLVNRSSILHTLLVLRTLCNLVSDLVNVSL
jgi:hypothetical protein